MRGIPRPVVPGPPASEVIEPEDLVALEPDIPMSALEECARSCGYSLFRDVDRGVTYAIVKRSLTERPAAIAQLRAWEERQRYPKRQARPEPERPYVARATSPIFPTEEGR